MSKIIECINVNKVFKNNSNEFKVLNNINFTIEEGEFVVIFGPSGSGKTTLLNIIAGLDFPTEGNVNIDGKDITTMNSKDLEHFRSFTIGYVFQSYGLISLVNCYDNICLGFVNRKYKKEEIMNLMKDLKIEELANRFPHELSGGQKQRVAIARTIAKNPKIVYSDEPTGALDEESSHIVIEMFKKMNKDGKTIVMVTHDERFEVYASTIIKIMDGKIIE